MTDTTAAMTTTIGAFDADTKQVSVTFVQAGVTHTRNVNACLDGAGAYDAEATAARVGEVALGVAYKIENGIITNPPPALQASDGPSTDTSATETATSEPAT